MALATKIYALDYVNFSKNIHSNLWFFFLLFSFLAFLYFPGINISRYFYIYLMSFCSVLRFLKFMAKIEKKEKKITLKIAAFMENRDKMTQSRNIHNFIARLPAKIALHSNSCGRISPIFINKHGGITRQLVDDKFLEKRVIILS